MTLFDRLRAGALGARTTGRWPLAVLAAILCLAYVPIFSGRIIFNRDLSRFLYPIRWFVGDSLRRGEGPWWIPHVGLGHSMLADPQSAIFYPANLLHLAGPLPLMMTVVCLLHVMWGAAGMMRVARAFRLADLPAVVVGLAWALSGYVASLWTNGARLPSAAWMSWQILAFVHLARVVRAGAPIGRALAWVALANGAGILAGDVFVAAMGGMLGLGLAAAWLMGERLATAARPQTVPWFRTTRIRFLAAALLGTGLGVLLSSVALLPAASVLQGTERSGGIPLEVAQAGSLHPLRLLEWFSPEAFARAWFLAPDQPWVASYLDGAPLSLSVYCGGSVLALVLLAFLPAPRREDGGLPLRATAGIVAGVGCAFLLLSLGRHTPCLALFRPVALPFRYMRAPEKFLLAVMPCVALLAGWGAQRLFEQPFRSRWPWGAGCSALLLALVLLAPWLLPGGLGSQVRQQGWHGLVAATLVLGVWALAARQRVAGGALLLVLVAVDLATATTLTLRFEKLSGLREPELAPVMQPATVAPSLPFPRLFRGGKVQLSAGQFGLEDGDRVTRETLRDNLSVPSGVAILPGYGVAIPPALSSLLQHGRLDVLRLLAVDFALLSTPASGPPVQEGLSHIAQPFPGVRLVRIERALPRVFVSFAVEARSPLEVSQHILDPDVVSGRKVLLEDGASGASPGLSPPSPVPCSLERFGNNRLRALCQAAAPGWAVFVEQFAPGWSATVDSVPTPLRKANAVMRAVPVPAGRHLIELVYAPPSLALGIACSLLGLCLIFTLLFLTSTPTRWS